MNTVQRSTATAAAPSLGGIPLACLLLIVLSLALGGGCNALWGVDELAYESSGGHAGAAQSTAGAGGEPILTTSGGTAGAGASSGCMPGAEQVFGDCGNCGTLLAICKPSGTWGAAECTGEGACAPGKEQATECGDCGTATSVCNDSCTWDPAGSCLGQGECSPGAKKQSDCGNCGTKTSVCSNNCTWDKYGSCTNEGACAPGDTKAGNCDQCAQKTCSNSCDWSTCKLKSGAQCEYQQGTNWEYCQPGYWHFCSSNCQWFPCQPM